MHAGFRPCHELEAPLWQWAQRSAFDREEIDRLAMRGSVNAYVRDLVDPSLQLALHVVDVFASRPAKKFCLTYFTLDSTFPFFFGA